MKLINRSKSNKAIITTSNFKIETKIQNSILRYKKIILKNGTKAFKQINDELGLKTPKTLKVSTKDIKKSEDLLTDNIKIAILQAANNIKTVCKSDLNKANFKAIETTKGIKIWKEFKPIDKVGIYVPGGSAPLVSSLLMQLIPAIVAGCKNITICTPPLKNGDIAPEILWASKQYGVTNIYKVGGAQAIFAMAYGSTIVPKVDKIFGPGNAYVNAAKQQISSEGISIDLPAGPSEVLVMTNDINKAKLAASDALSQLEHDPNSKALIMSCKLNVLNAVKKEIQNQKKLLKRQSILKDSIKNLLLIKAKSFVDSLAVINDCAPEHLILLDDDYSLYLKNINNAGSIFCGPLTPESFGDYASGTNHVLPTNGAAKTHSGLSINDFGKYISVQTASQEGFNNLKNTVIELANAEKLDAHISAVKIRETFLESLRPCRTSVDIRKTNETSIYINLNLDGSGNYNINTGIKYLDHLLEQLAKHSSIDLHLTSIGDLEIDEHHSIEDIAITLGESIKSALGQRNGISRYASSETLVMDEVQCNVSIDLSTRRYLKFKTSKLREFVGDFPTEMFKHFFVSLINSAALTCHINTTGENSHHILEATFKTFARAFKSAIVIESDSSSSTKGIL